MAEKTPEVIKSDCLLPDDLIGDILLRLPAKSIIRFRSVSKSWLAITTDPSFLLAHTGRAPNSLLIHTTTNQSHESHLRSIKLRLLLPAATPSDARILFSSVLPERRRSTTDVVFACCDGLICLRDRIRETLEQEDDVPCYYVINPLTGALIDVPKPRFSLGHLMGLYLHPPTGEYRLIRRINSSIVNNKIEVITLGGESWRTIQSSPPKELVCARIPIDLKGYLYWIAYNVNEFVASAVLLFDTTEEEFKLMPLPAQERRHYTNNSLFHMGERLGLSIIDRELSSASELGIDIWVLKDHETVEWQKMHSLKCLLRYIYICVNGLLNGSVRIR
ncbi:putative F-box protein [Platanthera zijinensis]|uniref:F-box protein n=1 Tax=Platanthera zijinensis TaxID=2320716 RepID=A0AAP0AYY9_9ASPA